MMDFGTSFLFFHALQVIGFLAWVGVACKKAFLKKELLASKEGFAHDYSYYVLRTGRSLPRRENLSLLQIRRESRKTIP
jgi:hypothetical protein